MLLVRTAETYAYESNVHETVPQLILILSLLLLDSQHIPWCLCVYFSA